MKLYFVTFDYLIGGKYRAQSARFFARNAKEACRTIKENYYERIEWLVENGMSYAKAKRETRWPFHIEAEAI